jgi:hypothetical protein
MVVRRLLAAVDRLLVLEIIGENPADTARELAAADPVDRRDDRIEPLVQVLSGTRWRDATLTGLVQVLLDTLDYWWILRDSLEDELARVLNDEA